MCIYPYISIITHWELVTPYYIWESWSILIQLLPDSSKPFITKTNIDLLSIGTFLNNFREVLMKTQWFYPENVFAVYKWWPFCSGLQNNLNITLYDQAWSGCNKTTEQQPQPDMDPITCIEHSLAHTDGQVIGSEWQTIMMQIEIQHLLHHKIFSYWCCNMCLQQIVILS